MSRGEVAVGEKQVSIVRRREPVICGRGVGRPVENSARVLSIRERRSGRGRVSLKWSWERRSEREGREVEWMKWVAMPW